MLTQAKTLVGNVQPTPALMSQKYAVYPVKPASIGGAFIVTVHAEPLAQPPIEFAELLTFGLGGVSPIAVFNVYAQIRLCPLPIEPPVKVELKDGGAIKPPVCQNWFATSCDVPLPPVSVPVTFPFVSTHNHWRYPPVEPLNVTPVG
jgi:hypothetical protein